MSRQRIDALLAERGIAPSRTSAAESVRAGRVRIGADGPLALKPSQLVAETAELIMVSEPPFVSRGGIKLANALDAARDRGRGGATASTSAPRPAASPTACCSAAPQA